MSPPSHVHGLFTRPLRHKAYGPPRHSRHILSLQTQKCTYGQFQPGNGPLMSAEQTRLWHIREACASNPEAAWVWTARPAYKPTERRQLTDSAVDASGSFFLPFLLGGLCLPSWSF